MSHWYKMNPKAFLYNTILSAQLQAWCAKKAGFFLQVCAVKVFNLIFISGQTEERA